MCGAFSSTAHHPTSYRFDFFLDSAQRQTTHWSVSRASSVISSTVRMQASIHPPIRPQSVRMQGEFHFYLVFRFFPIFFFHSIVIYSMASNSLVRWAEFSVRNSKHGIHAHIKWYETNLLPFRNQNFITYRFHVDVHGSISLSATRTANLLSHFEVYLRARRVFAVLAV